MNERYSRVFATPHFKRLLFSAIAGRFPIGIDALAIVLLVREEGGSFAMAGAVAGAFAAGGALGAPVQGRLMDRHGQRLLLAVAATHALALAVLVAVILGGAASGVVIAAGAFAGSCIPPLSSVMRALWPTLFPNDPDAVQTAFAVDSVAIEMVFVFGPLITAVTTALLSPAAAIAIAGVLVLFGTAAFVTSPPSRAWRPSPHAGSHGRLGALSSRGLRTILFVTIPVGFAFGAIDVTMPAFAEENGGRELAGPLIAAWALGSAASGIAYGARSRARSLLSSYLRFVALLPLTFVPLLAASSVPTMLPLAFVAGLAIAPTIAAANQLVSAVAPPGAVTEAYTWGITALVSGVAAGTAAGGALVDVDGWRTSVVAGVAAACVAVVVAFTRRATLAPSPPGSGALSDPAPA